MRDIVGLYLNPPDHAVVFCADVKPQIQALDRTAPLLPLQPGQVERRTHDDKRHGTTSLYAALNVTSGEVILDNASAPESALIRRWLERHPRFQFHYTPTYASWINLVERWFSALTTKQLRRGVHRSVHELVDAIREFIRVHNETGKPYVWTRTADEILASIARFAQRILRAHGAQ